MNTTQPIDRPSEMVSRTREAELLSMLFVIMTSILCWYMVAAVNYSEQRQDECRAWVVQQTQESQEGPAL